MTREDLEKQDKCKHLLDAPAPLVVGKLIEELRRYMDAIDELEEQFSCDIFHEITDRYNLHNANVESQGVSAN